MHFLQSNMRCFCTVFVQDRCPAPQGAGGLKFVVQSVIGLLSRSRPPQGAGGLKCSPPRSRCPRYRPARGGWIEICFRGRLSRPARAGGLKCWKPRHSRDPAPQAGRVTNGRTGSCPAPQGAGGLKYARLHAPFRGHVRRRADVPPRGGGSLSFGSFFLQCTAQNIGFGALSAAGICRGPSLPS